MLKKAMVGIAIVGLNAVDAYSLQKRDGAHAHDHGHAAPAPSSGYEEPASSYGAPAASYGAPAASYGAPAPSYDAAPSYGADEAALPDLTPIIIGILALVGLSLLFPTFVSVSARKKRSAAEGKHDPPQFSVGSRFCNVGSGLVLYFSPFLLQFISARHFPSIRHACFSLVRKYS